MPTRVYSQPVRCLLSSVLPKGRGLVLMLKLYADESVDNDTSLMNVSGYLMTEDQFAALDDAVRIARGDLLYFHMKESHHLKYPDIYQKLVGLIRPETVICGLSVYLYLNDYKTLSAAKSEYTRGQSLAYWFGGAYTYATGAMMALCSGWLDESDLYRDEQVAYIFENNPHQGNADTFWGLLDKPQFADRKQQNHYISHTFVDGKGPLGSVLQVCDILAWNLNKMQREKQKTPELNRLFLTPTFWFHHGPKEISKTLHGALD